MKKFCLLFCQMIYLIYIYSVESWLVWMFIPQAVLSILQADLSVLFMVFIYLHSPLKAEFQHRKCWKCTVLQQCMSCLTSDVLFRVWFVWCTEENRSKWHILNFITFVLQISFGPVLNRIAPSPKQIFGKSLKFGTYGR